MHHFCDKGCSPAHCWTLQQITTSVHHLSNLDPNSNSNCNSRWAFGMRQALRVALESKRLRGHGSTETASWNSCIALCYSSGSCCYVHCGFRTLAAGFDLIQRNLCTTRRAVVTGFEQNHTHPVHPLDIRSEPARLWASVGPCGCSTAKGCRG